MKKYIYTCIILFVFQACTHTYSIFSTKYPVSFSCDVTQSPFTSLETWGYFLAVRQTPIKDGYMVKLPDGTERNYPYTEIQNRIFEFGLGGIIIGRPYFGEGEIFAYDWACPLCERSSVRLSLGNDGMATCRKCGHEYDLNNGGTPKSGDSRPLYRYRTTLNGNILMIHH